MNLDVRTPIVLYIYEKPLKSAYFFGQSPWFPSAKSQKMRNLGVLVEFVTTPFCGQFWSRRLLQNVLRCVHFKPILMRK